MPLGMQARREQHGVELTSCSTPLRVLATYSFRPVRPMITSADVRDYRHMRELCNITLLSRLFRLEMTERRGTLDSVPALLPYHPNQNLPWDPDSKNVDAWIRPNPDLD